MSASSKAKFCFSPNRYVDELFSWLGDRAVMFGVSRLVVDPERFVDDDQEAMASKGMGVIYTRTSDD
jgi:N-formylglutamate deformylase